MPNWTSNEVRIEGSADDIRKIRDFVKSDESAFDFDRIVPMPKDLLMEAGGIMRDAIAVAKTRKGYAPRAKTLANVRLPRVVSLYRGRENVTISTEDELAALGRAYLSNEKKYGARDWYDWCCINWGTKWNACKCSIAEDADETVVYEFQTAWADPDPVIVKLSNLFPSVTIALSSAYEDPEPWHWYSKDYKAGKLVGTHDWIDQDLKDEYDEMEAEYEEECG